MIGGGCCGDEVLAVGCCCGYGEKEEAGVGAKEGVKPGAMSCAPTFGSLGPLRRSQEGESNVWGCGKGVGLLGRVEEGCWVVGD